jgi:hypothetical protein
MLTTFHCYLPPGSAVTGNAVTLRLGPAILPRLLFCRACLPFSSPVRLPSAPAAEVLRVCRLRCCAALLCCLLFSALCISLPALTAPPAAAACCLPLPPLLPALHLRTLPLPCSLYLYHATG